MSASDQGACRDLPDKQCRFLLITEVGHLVAREKKALEADNVVK